MFPALKSHKTLSLQVESDQEDSTLSLYKSLAKLRQYTAFQNDHINFPTFHDDVLHYTRSDGTNTFCIVINFGQDPITFDTGLHQKYGFVEAATCGIFRLYHTTISLERIDLNRGDGIVIKEIQ